ncbi:hypothetical protein MPH47_06135 [Psychrobacillus psychrodurans]|uniref:hypothetical protein n=1 Tax=Psychrobacillus psychrodurans TaxID=126157 RepID=UPI001F4E84F0|nr:hypothetical protein [Psychrobacillus psychrodurans]MCK1996809.1 hypothetical protein [Psychrobacillus psychrodurans]
MYFVKKKGIFIFDGEVNNRGEKMDYYKNKNSNAKVQAVKRIQDRMQEQKNQPSQINFKVIRTKVEEIDNLTMRTIGDSLGFSTDDSQTLNDLFDHYKSEIEEFVSTTDQSDEAYKLLEEITSNENFTNTEKIKTRQEFAKRLDELSKIINKYQK